MKASKACQLNVYKKKQTEKLRDNELHHIKLQGY